MVYRILTDAERRTVVLELERDQVQGKLSRGALKHAASRWECSYVTICRLWRLYKKNIDSRTPLEALTTKWAHSGRRPPSEACVEKLQALIKATPAHKRGDLRSLAASVGISTTTLYRFLKRGHLVAHTLRVKPLLSPLHRMNRLCFALSFVSRDADGFFVDGLYDCVHVDEKWFELKRVKRRVYLTPCEAHPYDAVQSKSHVPKVMFLCAVARPRFDRTRNKAFTGKIGMWPFVEAVPAQRSSRNRPAGTLELKPVTITKDVYRDALVNKVLPAIKEKWPNSKLNTIYIQQDNARPHVRIDDPAVASAAAQGGWSIKLRAQPPQSPDLNVLDLGFFSSIQNLQHKKPAASIRELIDNCHTAFNELDPVKLDDTFITLQHVLNEVIEARGGNEYKLPRQSKAKLRRAGTLPLRVRATAVPDAADALLCLPLMTNEIFQ